MAFIGIFLLIVIAWIILLVAVSIFVPSLIIFIINIVKGCKNKWPTHNIVAVSITGTILVIFTLLIFICLFNIIFNRTTIDTESVEDVAAMLLLY